MNIFILDNNIEKSAQSLIDKHVVKMPLETAQILSSALYINTEKIYLYKPTHLKHPCVIWASSTQSNFNWLINYGLEICKEYTARYNKIHKSECIIGLSLKYIDFIPKGEKTKHVLVMPDVYKKSGVIESYRNYYIGDKKSIATWRNKNKPDWWIK